MFAEITVSSSRATTSAAIHFEKCLSRGRATIANCQFARAAHYLSGLDAAISTWLDMPAAKDSPDFELIGAIAADVEDALAEVADFVD